MDYSYIYYLIPLGLFAIRCFYARNRLLAYCKMHHPEKASEFQRLGVFAFTRALFKEHDIHDLGYITRKNNAKNAYACIWFALLLSVLFVTVLGVIPFLFGKLN